MHNISRYFDHTRKQIYFNIMYKNTYKCILQVKHKNNYVDQDAYNIISGNMLQQRNKNTHK